MEVYGTGSMPVDAWQHGYGALPALQQCSQPHCQAESVDVADGGGILHTAEQDGQKLTFIIVPPRASASVNKKRTNSGSLLSKRAIPSIFTPHHLARIQAQMGVLDFFARGEVPPQYVLEAALATNTTGPPLAPPPVPPPDFPHQNDCTRDPWMETVLSVAQLPANNGSAIRAKINQAIKDAEGQPLVQKQLKLAIGGNVYKGNNAGTCKQAALQVLSLHNPYLAASVQRATYRPPAVKSQLACKDTDDSAEFSPRQLLPGANSSQLVASGLDEVSTETPPHTTSYMQRSEQEAHLGHTHSKFSSAPQYPTEFGEIPGESPEDEKLFYASLQAFLKQKDDVLLDGPGWKIPVVAGNKLNICKLYREVCKRGGKDKVIQDKGWRAIADNFGVPATLTSASTTMKQYYIKFLAAYEEQYFQRANIAALQQSSTSPIKAADTVFDVRVGSSGSLTHHSGTEQLQMSSSGQFHLSAANSWSLQAAPSGTDTVKPVAHRFTDDEELLVAYGYTNFGSSWSKIQELLPWRSAQQIKKRWHSAIKDKLMKGKILVPAEQPVVNLRTIPAATGYLDQMNNSTHSVLSEPTTVQQSHLPQGKLKQEAPYPSFNMLSYRDTGHQANGLDPSDASGATCSFPYSRDIQIHQAPMTVRNLHPMSSSLTALHQHPLVPSPPYNSSLDNYRTLHNHNPTTTTGFGIGSSLPTTNQTHFGSLHNTLHSTNYSSTLQHPQHNPPAPTTHPQLQHAMLSSPPLHAFSRAPLAPSLTSLSGLSSQNILQHDRLDLRGVPSIARNQLLNSTFGNSHSLPTSACDDPYTPQNQVPLQQMPPVATSNLFSSVLPPTDGAQLGSMGDMKLHHVDSQQSLTSQLLSYNLLQTPEPTELPSQYNSSFGNLSAIQPLQLNPLAGSKPMTHAVTSLQYTAKVSDFGCVGYQSPLGSHTGPPFGGDFQGYNANGECHGGPTFDQPLGERQVAQEGGMYGMMRSMQLLGSNTECNRFGEGISFGSYANLNSIFMDGKYEGPGVAQESQLLGLTTTNSIANLCGSFTQVHNNMGYLSGGQSDSLGGGGLHLSHADAGHQM